MARNWVRREHLWTLRLNSKTGQNKTGRMVGGGGVSKRADLVGLCDRWWLMVVTVHQTRGSLKKRKKVLGVSLQYGRRWFWGYLWRADLEQTEPATGLVSWDLPFSCQPRFSLWPNELNPPCCASPWEMRWTSGKIVWHREFSDQHHVRASEELGAKSREWEEEIRADGKEHSCP